MAQPSLLDAQHAEQSGSRTKVQQLADDEQMCAEEQYARIGLLVSFTEHKVLLAVSQVRHLCQICT